MRKAFQDTDLAGGITKPSAPVGDNGQGCNQPQESRWQDRGAGGQDNPRHCHRHPDPARARHHHYLVSGPPALARPVQSSPVLDACAWFQPGPSSPAGTYGFAMPPANSVFWNAFRIVPHRRVQPAAHLCNRAQYRVVGGGEPIGRSAKSLAECQIAYTRSVPAPSV